MEIKQSLMKEFQEKSEKRQGPNKKQLISSETNLLVFFQPVLPTISALSRKILENTLTYTMSNIHK